MAGPQPRRRPYADSTASARSSWIATIPSKVIGRLREPLLKPNQNEREGYVPNVVYTCGALVHNGELIIPYGLADHATGFATVPLAEVLAAMEQDDSMTIPNKRIAVLSPVAWRTPPRQYGAWETVAGNITEGLVARGWDVTLFATGDSVTRGSPACRGGPGV